MERKMNDVKSQMEKSVRSIKYAANYGIHFNVPNSIIRNRKGESVDTLMKRLYVMPLPKGNQGLLHGMGFLDDEEDGEEDEEGEGMRVSSVRRGAQSPIIAIGNSRSGIESGVRTVSKGVLSASDSNDSNSTQASGNGGLHSPSSTTIKSFSAKTAGSKRGGLAGGDDDDEGRRPKEGEDDEGFGPINISAHRIPTEDTALNRFIRRATVNGGEAAQISHLRSMEWVSMPRSEEEILATLDKRFYERDFDPALHVLESFPALLEDFNAYVEKQLSEKDIAKEHIMAKLATRMEANYHVLIEGMKNVQEVDLDLMATSMQTVECRRRLSMADDGVLDPLLHILHKRIRRENLQKVANILKYTHGALRLEREAKRAFAAGRLEQAIIAATDAKLALDSDVLKNVNMMEEVAQSLDQLLPELRLAVDKSLRRLCSGSGGGGSSAAFLSTEYAWILRAYLTLDDHGIRLSSKPRSANNASPLYVHVEGVEPNDSLAQGIVPIAPTVDRGGIPGLSERIQRFIAMELDYCIKVAVIEALMPASAAKPVSIVRSSSGSSSCSSTAASTTASLAAKALSSASASQIHVSTPSRRSFAPVSDSPSPPSQQHQKQQQQQQQQQQPPLPSSSLPPTVGAAAAPDVVRDVHERIIAWKGRYLNAWMVTDLIEQLPAGAAVGVLGELAEQVTEILHRCFLLMQWHRSPFDVQNKDEAFLHRPAASTMQTSCVVGELSDDDEEEEEVEGGGEERSPGKKVAAVGSGSMDGCDEEDEEVEEKEEEDDESFISPVVQDGSKLDAAEMARVLKERKEELELARLAAVERGLKQVRTQLWVPIERAVVALLAEEEIGLESLVQVLATGELLAALGEEFGHNKSTAIKNLIHTKCELVLKKTHQECFAVVQQMIDRETWFSVPISVEDLGGMAGVVNNHVKPLFWPAMNGWGYLMKERVLQRDGAISPLSILSKFVSVGNPFLGSSFPSKLPADPSLVIFSVLPPPSSSSSSSSNSSTSTNKNSRSSSAPSSEEGPTSPVIPRPTPVWTMTQAALNGFARYAGRYLQLMHLYPTMALETYTALLQLLDFYVYMVFAIFVPEQSAQLFLSHTSNLNRQSSVVEEISWVNQEVHMPLPCEAWIELVQLRNYLNRIRDDLIESEHWELAMEMEAAYKIKTLGADTAKMCSALAVTSGATGSAMVIGGGWPGSPVQPAQLRQQQQHQEEEEKKEEEGVFSASSRPWPHAAVSKIQGFERAAAGDDRDDKESDEDEGADHRSAVKVGSKRIIRKFHFERPSFITETLEDAATLFGLSNRAVAVESCLFVLEILKSLQSQVLLVLPDKKGALGGGRGTAETYLETATEAISQLRILTYRCAAPRLIGAAGLVHAIEEQQWNQHLIRDEANPYTDKVCGTCSELWEKVKGPEGGVVAGLGGCVYIPPSALLLIWTEVTQSVMGALLEGFARVKRCSTEGRSLMSMDLQAVQRGLDRIHKVRPIRGKMHVDNYVKAFYYGEADVMAWIEQNYQNYAFRHMAGLLNVGVGQKKKRGLRELVIKVAALYASEEDFEEEEEGCKEGEERGTVHGAGKDGGRSGGATGASSLFGLCHDSSTGSSSTNPALTTPVSLSSSSSSSNAKASMSSTFSNMMQGKGLRKGFL